MGLNLSAVRTEPVHDSRGYLERGPVKQQARHKIRRITRVWTSVIYPLSQKMAFGHLGQAANRME